MRFGIPDYFDTYIFLSTNKEGCEKQRQKTTGKTDIIKIKSFVHTQHCHTNARKNKSCYCTTNKAKNQSINTGKSSFK